jgi:hypothetical protein
VVHGPDQGERGPEHQQRGVGLVALQVQLYADTGQQVVQGLGNMRCS